MSRKPKENPKGKADAIPTARSFVTDLGGMNVVSLGTGASLKSIEGWGAKGEIPARWYVALCQMAQAKGIEAPSLKLFSFANIAAPSGAAPKLDSSEATALHK